MRFLESSFLVDKIDHNPADPQAQYYNAQVYMSE